MSLMDAGKWFDSEMLQYLLLISCEMVAVVGNLVAEDCCKEVLENWTGIEIPRCKRENDCGAKICCDVSRHRRELDQ